jgi:hypothetical protein
LDQIKDRELIRERLRQHELKQRNDERLERDRLLKLEQTLIKELREKLMALLNE